MNTSLSNIFQGKVVIVGVGNRLRGDDGFGSFLADELKGKIKAECLDVGNAPENYVGKIAKSRPDTVLIVDAVFLGKNPGEYELLESKDIMTTGFTTHDIPLSMFIDYLEKESGAKIYMLGVEPDKVDFSASMSEAVRKTLSEIRDIIIQEMERQNNRYA